MSVVDNGEDRKEIAQVFLRHHGIKQLKAETQLLLCFNYVKLAHSQRG